MSQYISKMLKYIHVFNYTSSFAMLLESSGSHTGVQVTPHTPQGHPLTPNEYVVIMFCHKINRWFLIVISPNMRISIHILQSQIIYTASVLIHMVLLQK